MATVAEDAPAGGTDDRGFFGHPKGLAYLAFTEAWERFSYYGMTALLVLYMVDQLLLPGHVEQVAGMAAWRGALESLFGPLSDQALASQTFGLYSGLVYFTPLLGGLVADRLIGTKRAVLLGALTMCAGHFAMAFDVSFLIALLLLIAGSGLLKGNIAAQVGHLYPADDESRRTRAFAIFSMAINVGATLGPLGCGLVAQIYGWHAGFALAGLLMLLATAIYLAGQKHLPAPKPVRAKRIESEAMPLTALERRKVAALVAVLFIAVFQTAVHFQIFNVGLIWIRDHAELATPLGAIPVPWFNSIDALSSVLMVPPLVWLWARQAKAGREPGDLAKIAIGAAIAAGAMAVFALAAALAGEGRTSALLPALAFALIGLAFLWYWPVTLALVSRTAPARVNATMMGMAYLAIFAGNIAMGWIGSLYERMTPVEFWLVNVGVAGIGAVLVLVFGRSLSRVLAEG
jgi:POT family proton-dependent oligopeptide transporter